MKSILITGATGFVGRTVTQFLLKRGDRLTAALRSPQAAERLPSEVRPAIVGEIGPETSWSAAFADQPIDAVVHLAARVHVMREKSANPLDDFERVNAVGTEMLARAAVSAGVRKFVYVSSYHAMAVHSETVLTEETPCRPITPYGVSKLNGEIALKSVCEGTPMRYTIIRSPPVYGPGQLGNMKRMFKAVHRGWPLPFGCIESCRSLVFIENLASAILASLDHPNAADETFLVNDGENQSVRSILRKFGTAAGRKSRLIPAPEALLRLAGKMLGKSAEVDRFLGPLFADDRKIRSRLDWSPPVSVPEALAKTANWLKDVA